MINKENNLIVENFVSKLLEKGYLNEEQKKQYSLLDKNIKDILTSLEEQKIISNVNLYTTLAEVLETDFISPSNIKVEFVDLEFIEQKKILNIMNELSFLVFKIDYIYDLFGLIIEKDGKRVKQKLETEEEIKLEEKIKKIVERYSRIVVTSKFYDPIILQTIKTLVGTDVYICACLSDVIQRVLIRISTINLDAQVLDLDIEKRINKLFDDALFKFKASDIHIEPLANSAIIRMRIDGDMKTIKELNRNEYEKIARILYIKANLNYDQFIKINDAKIVISILNKDYDVRFSSIPTIYGTSIVLRLYGLNETLELEDLGFLESELNKLLFLINNPYGIILITGATGSGKSTTLYSILKRLSRDTTKKILTIEDPVEIAMPTIQQMNVAESRGITFQTAVRAFLRQDPDVIMVGEIRDKDTANEAVNAAITGHLVFSTLHTNTVLEAPIRLVLIGMEQWKIASGLLGIVGQRLIKKICPKCRIKISREELRELIIKEKYNFDLDEVYHFKNKEEFNEFYIPNKNGCDNCLYTGYKGRTVVTETLIVDEPVKEVMRQTIDPDKIRKATEKSKFDYCSMLKNGSILVKKGIISPLDYLRTFGSLTYTVHY